MQGEQLGLLRLLFGLSAPQTCCINRMPRLKLGFSVFSFAGGGAPKQASKNKCEKWGGLSGLALGHDPYLVPELGLMLRGLR